MIAGCTGKNNIKEKSSTEVVKDTFPAGEKYALWVNEGRFEDTVTKSVQRRTVSIIDSNKITIDYYSPAVKGRVIWGGLVPYDQVWVTGAHSATKISFTKDIVINNTTVPAGSYAIFTIPGKKSWTFILNKNFEQHLADDYKTTEDITRMEIPYSILERPLPRLTYLVIYYGQGEGRIEMKWEKINISVPFYSLKQTSVSGNMMGGRKKLSGIITHNKRDLVCFMPVTAGITDTVTYQKKLYGFCSAECRRLFVEDPEKYLASQ